MTDLLTAAKLDRERLLQAMDVLLDVMRVAGAMASSGENAEMASAQFAVAGIQRLTNGLVAEGHPLVAHELLQLLLQAAPPDVLAEVRQELADAA